MSARSGKPDVSAASIASGWRDWLYLAPTTLLLFVLPIDHTTALRMIFLAGTAIATACFWRKTGSPKVPLLLAFGFCGAAAFASLFTATDAVSSFQEIKKELGYGLVTFVAFFSLSRGPRELRTWLFALAASLTVLGTYALWAHSSVGTLNFDGWHGGVLNYSVFIATMFPLLLCALFFPKINRLWRYMALVLMPLALFTGYLTGNRILWLSIIASSLVFTGLYLKHSASKKARVSLLAGLLVIVTVSLAGFAWTAAKRTGAGVDFAANLATILEKDPRTMLWSYGIQHIREHPWTGTGFGRMQQAHKFSEHFSGEPYYVHAHNMFINYGIQMGIPGILSYLFLFFCVIREFSRLYRSPDHHAALIGVTGIAIVVAVVLKSATDDQFVRHNALLFWALVGMGLGYGTRLARGIGATAAAKVT